jgi:tRNA (guanine10-N2)-methyltransferase
MEGPINLKTPDVEFAILEDYGFNPNDHIPPEDLKTVYFGVHIATGNRDLVKNYSLKSRKYIGNTSMDAELSLIMANMALCTAGKLVYDPFVGTGSFLVTSSHYGSYTMGSDIDGRQIRGRDGNSIKSNLDQYNMKNRMVDTLVFDVCNHPWRSTPLFDAICTDPPYGVRAGAKRLGRKRGNRTVEEIPLVDGVPSHLRTDYRPPTVPYDMPEVLADLLEFAAKYLVVGGRIAYWLPNVVEEDEDPETPYHPNLELIADSEQPFNGWSRRLVVMEKKSEYDPSLPFDKPSNVDPKLIFRNRYFLPNQPKE